MKYAVLCITMMSLSALSGCSQTGAVKTPKQYTVNVYRDDIPVNGAQVRLVVWRKTEVIGTVDNPADIIHETRTDSQGIAEIPVKRKSSFGIKVTACISEVIWNGDAWVSRKTERVEINLEQTSRPCEQEHAPSTT